jgi:hypothetical protein
MQVETFRYLMSALAQVYGALIFGVAVFLVLRYRELRGTASSCAFEFAWFIVRIDHPLGQWWKSAGLIDIEMRRRLPKILASGPQEIDDLANAALSKLDGKDPNETPVEELRTGIERSAEQCKNSRLALRRFRREATGLMACPASLCWLFSFGLLFADRLRGPLQTENVAGWAVVLAGAGLGYVVLAAVEVLRDAGPEAGEKASSTEQGGQGAGWGAGGRSDSGGN